MVKHIRSSLGVISFTVALLSTGCTVATTVGTQDSSLSGAETPHAIAFHVAPDETTLHVLVSTFALSCDNPGQGSTSDDGSCPVGWTVGFQLPSGSQVPGSYDLGQPTFQAFETFSLGTAGNGDGCIGGGGGAPLPRATVEILSIDANGVDVRLSGYDGDADFPSANGDYTAPLCK